MSDRHRRSDGELPGSVEELREMAEREREQAQRNREDFGGGDYSGGQTDGPEYS